LFTGGRPRAGRQAPWAGRQPLDGRRSSGGAELGLAGGAELGLAELGWTVELGAELGLAGGREEDPGGALAAGGRRWLLQRSSDAAVRLQAGGRRLKKRKKTKYSRAPLVDACLRLCGAFLACK
jgi:hypothetical protein